MPPESSLKTTQAAEPIGATAGTVDSGQTRGFNSNNNEGGPSAAPNAGSGKPLLPPLPTLPPTAFAATDANPDASEAEAEAEERRQRKGKAIAAVVGVWQPCAPSTSYLLDDLETIDDPGQLRGCTTAAVRQVWLNERHLESLSASLYSFYNLEVLVLSGNRLDNAAVEPVLTNIEFGRLRWLELARNRLSGTLSPAIAKLHRSLCHLDIGENNIERLPNEFALLSNLQHLNVSYNSLSRSDGLPYSLSRLTALMVLDISGNRLYGGGVGSDIIDVCCSLSPDSLRTLNLSAMRLAEIPEGISRLASLSVLYADDNELTTIPESISALTSLTDLRLGDNRIDSLPATAFAALTALRMVDIHNNPIAVLPTSLFRESLEQLSLYGTAIQRLPAAIGSLTRITSVDLHNCTFLSSLPDSLFTMTNLQSLDLSNTRIESLPETIVNLAVECGGRLRELRLNDCRHLKHLPRTAFDRLLPSLRVAEFRGTLPAEVNALGALAIVAFIAGSLSEDDAVAMHSDILRAKARKVHPSSSVDSPTIGRGYSDHLSPSSPTTETACVVQ